MEKCLICDEPILIKGGLTIDDADNIKTICRECNEYLKERIALVVVDPRTLKKTGEFVFIGKIVFVKYASELPVGGSIYMVNSNCLRTIVDRLIHSENEKK
ncbi:MAG: hypothetical protein MUO72_09705 [Bacteroidales bacterium]|nr:hypothetical protein [Bacteroidales bacterium]